MPKQCHIRVNLRQRIDHLLRGVQHCSKTTNGPKEANCIGNILLPGIQNSWSWNCTPAALPNTRIVFQSMERPISIIVPCYRTNVRSLFTKRDGSYVVPPHGGKSCFIPTKQSTTRKPNGIDS